MEKVELNNIRRFDEDTEKIATEVVDTAYKVHYKTGPWL
jgi:hypothetical protein